ncbi:hypothetical protein L7F22_064070 [Adiantum nelumboides]|nr:hypothetical protein [Adiantum nelumboides]
MWAAVWCSEGGNQQGNALLFGSIVGRLEGREQWAAGAVNSQWGKRACGLMWQRKGTRWQPSRERPSRDGAAPDQFKTYGGDGYEVFTGCKAEDVDKFIRRIELKSNRDDGAFKICLVSLLLEGEAREWYEDRLEDEKKANWNALSQALKEGVCGSLHHGIREKVELKDPRTYNEAVRIAREQWRKKVRRHEMANMEREGVVHQRDAYVPMHNVVESLPLDIHVETDVHVEAPSGNNRGQEAFHYDIQRFQFVCACRLDMHEILSGWQQAKFVNTGHSYLQMTWTFSRWKAVVRSLNFKREVEHTADLRKKHKFFCKWAEVVKMQGRWTECQVSVICLRQTRWVKLIFRIWLQRSCDQRKEREGNVKALMFARHCMLSRVFKRFMGWMHGRQMKEGFTLLACGKLQHVYLKRAFDAWLRQVEIHVRKQTAHDQLQRVWDHHLLAKSFNGMQGVVTENWHLKGCVVQAFRYNVMVTKLDKVVFLQKQRFCHSLLQHWRKRTLSCNVSRHNEQRLKVKILQRALHEWNIFAQNKLHLDVMARQLSTLHSNFLRKQCWVHWQFRTEKAQYQQQFLLFKTFRAWVKYTKMKAFKRCMERDATTIILQSLQKRVLWGWQSLVREIAIRREEHQQQRFLQREAMVLANRTERRQKIESLSAIFKAWQARFQQAVHISMFIERQKVQLKKSVWLSWISWLNLENSARRVRHQWITVVLKSKLNVWRKVCAIQVSKSREREVDAAKFASWKLKRLVWPQWKSYVGSCKERVKALQDCLAIIQTRQDCDWVRGIIRAWRDYTLERGKRREHSWAAEASYKRHKLADYLTAWHDYTAAAKESASSLKGTIQVYQSSSHFGAMADSMYSFRQGFGHISRYMTEGTSFRDIGAPTVVIEEVGSSVEENEGTVLSHPAQWAMPQALLETEGSSLARFISSNGGIHSPSQFLQNGTLWNPGRSIKYLGLEIEDDTDNWSLKDVEIDAS